MTEIYYIEDDTHIAKMVEDYLMQKAYIVSIFPTLTEVKRVLVKHVPHMVLVDWNMPDGEGSSICRWIRATWRKLPIMFLTVRNDTCDVIAGFEHGADDYMVKPFALEVLHLRIKALLRRAGDFSAQCLSCGAISIDKEKKAVFCQGTEIMLSHTEYQLLLLLMMHKGKTITRECLLAQIWDINGNYVNDNTLTVTMKRLREKLHQPQNLITVRSFGYRMEDEL